MQRMHYFFALTLLSSVFVGLTGKTAEAALLHPDDKTTFPDLSTGFVSGSQTYNASTGQFHAENIPFALALGAKSTDSYDVTSTDSGGRLQMLNLKVDNSGQLVNDPANNFELTGKVTIGGQTFTGLLLKGSVYAALGSLDLSKAPTNIQGASMFDVDLKIDKTNSLLGQAFSGGYAYLRLTVERGSTFNGSFANDFSGFKVAGNLRAYPGLPPVPVPEPTALVVLLAAGAGLLVRRHRRRISKADLVAQHLG